MNPTLARHGKRSWLLLLIGPLLVMVAQGAIEVVERAVFVQRMDDVGGIVKRIDGIGRLGRVDIQHINRSLSLSGGVKWIDFCYVTTSGNGL